MRAHAFTLADKVALARAFAAMMRPIPQDSTENLADWLKRHRQTRGAMERFWRLVIASALNADLDEIGVQYAAKVIRGLFHGFRRRGRNGNEHRAAERIVCAGRSVSGVAVRKCRTQHVC